MKVAKSHIFSNPIHALASLIKCRYCEGEVVQVSSKDGGYYGCYNAKRESCNNKLLISWKLVEAIIINDLKEKFLTVESFKYIDKLVLKGLLGAIEFEPIEKRCRLVNAQLIKSCSYYVAHTSVQTLALLDEEYKF
jgi:hypothetical protein